MDEWAEMIAVINTSTIALLALAMVIWALLSLELLKGLVKPALWIGCVPLLVVEICGVAVLMASGKPLDFVDLVISDVTTALRLTLAALVGLAVCRAAGWPGAPLVMRDRTTSEDERGRPVRDAFLVFAGGLLLSCVLYLAFDPQMSSLVRSALAGPRDAADTWAVGCVVVSAAIGEETLYRLGAVSFLSRIFSGSTALPIVVSSTLWAFAHIGVVDPNWIKLAQIFPLGLALGWGFCKYGWEWCVAVHVAFNLVMWPLGEMYVT